ncbi:DNA repair protein RadA [bacterium]|nr:DNA repair protein RadA [bacterium]
MPKDKLKTIYVCTQCGETSPRWLGRCPSCGSWNTMTEDVVAEPAKSASGRSAAPARVPGQTSLKPLRLKNVSTTEEKSRIVTGIRELDRVLGGGIVLGSVILIGGEPGIGKSTILLQLCGEVSRTRNVLYVTGEESVRQIKLRAERLRVPQDNISLVAESDVDEICGLIEQMKPDLVVFDSIQTMRCTDVASSSGTVSQVKESTARFLSVAKTNEIPTFIVGHVNKDGAIAGPKVMEHIVDTVLYFEGDKTLPYRVLRAVKNRYGSTNEIGMFDMTGKGLEQIENPSQVMLEGRPIGISGTCVACVMEGTRPVLSEIQSLVTKTTFPSPRRTASGFDYNRMYLLLAVLEKRAGYVFANQDVYVNIIGGLRLDETACDLPVCLAMASSLLDLPVPEKTLAIGEVGLGGEIRSVPHLETRLREAQRVGFDTALVPKHNLKMIDPAQFPGLHLVGAAYLREAINAIKLKN